MLWLYRSVRARAKYLKNLWTDFDEIFWTGGTWPKTSQLDFGGDPG